MYNKTFLISCLVLLLFISFSIFEWMGLESRTDKFPMSTLILVSLFVGFIFFSWITIFKMIYNRFFKERHYIETDVIIDWAVVHATWLKKYARIWKDQLYGKWTLLWEKIKQEGIYYWWKMIRWSSLLNNKWEITEFLIEEWEKKFIKWTFLDWKIIEWTFKKWKLIKSKIIYPNNESSFIHSLRQASDIQTTDVSRSKSIIVRNIFQSNALVEFQPYIVKSIRCLKYRIILSLWMQFDDNIPMSFCEFCIDNNSKTKNIPIIFDIKPLLPHKHYVFCIQAIDSTDNIVDVSNEFTFQTIRN